MGWIVVALGVVVVAAAGTVISQQAGAGTQPWSPELSDNLIFARTIPFIIALGVAAGMLGTLGKRLGLWTFALGLVLAIPTGSYEYLGGLLDVHPPFDLHLVYRVHYIGAGLVLFSVGAIVVSVWRSGDRSFLVPRGMWRAYLRGAADEVPPQLAKPLAGPLGVDLRAAPPARGQYSFYETVISFPWWGIGIALITVTGLIKALRYLYPVPGGVLYWSSTLHVAAMVIIGLKVLDQLRIELAKHRQVALAAAFAVWALLSLAVAYFFLWSAFLAKTAAKEGILSQLSLVFGGLAVAAFALLVMRQCFFVLRGRTA